MGSNSPGGTALRPPIELPAPLPAATFLVGAPDWADADRPLVATLDEAAALLGPATPADDPGADERADSPAPLVILDGTRLSPDAQATELPATLAGLLRRRPDAAVVLLFSELDAAACAGLFRAGLFDALALPVPPERWADLLARLEARREQVGRTSALRRQGEETSRRLHAHRRQLQDEVSRVGDELIASQRRLELVNQELTDHMSQLALLYRFGRELSSARNWDAALSGLLESLARFVGARGAALVLRAAPGAPYAPRQTYAWEEARWDRILMRLDEQVAQAVADRLPLPGMYQMDRELTADDAPRRAITALPLEHQGARLGYLLLLDGPRLAGETAARRAPFLQAVQVILAEEVAGAQMLDRIRELGAFNARVLDTVRSGIWVMDEQARTVYCNRHGRELIGAPVDATPAGAGAAIGRGRVESAASDSLREWLPHGDDLPELFRDGRLRLGGLEGVPFARLMAPEAAPYQGEGQILRDAGETIPVLVQASTMPGRRRGERWLVLVLEDLREAKRLEAERIRADSLEGMVEMSAALAHEIRNPLMGLSAQAELLAGHLPAGDSRKRYLDVITGEVDRINSTITRLLQFVRPYEPRLDAADLATLARDCLLLLEPKAAERRVRLQLRLEPVAAGRDAWTQAVDAGQIKQVLLNLLLNALDASPAGGAVEVVLRREARLELRDARSGAGPILPGLALEVRDTGSGFAPQDAERLFRPFYTTKSAGTGLGLSICRKIVAAHGGEIHAVRAEHTTVLRVLLPRTEALARRQEET
ncbi:MAG: ATP-binding protein [Candidatus Krumholzibacteriia bacterium]